MYGHNSIKRAPWLFDIGTRAICGWKGEKVIIFMQYVNLWTMLIDLYVSKHNNDNDDKLVGMWK